MWFVFKLYIFFRFCRFWYNLFSVDCIVIGDIVLFVMLFGLVVFSDFFRDFFCVLLVMIINGSIIERI